MDISYLVLSGFQANIVAEFEHASKRIVEHGYAFLAQSEVEDHHAACVKITITVCLERPEVEIGTIARVLPRSKLKALVI